MCSPDAYPLSRFESIGILHRHRFLINEKGVATVVPDNANNVIGIVWTITETDKASLDHYEGVQSNHYSPAFIPVVVGYQSYNSLIYIATNSTPGRARSGYMEKIFRAASTHGFDSRYLTYLAGF